MHAEHEALSQPKILAEHEHTNYKFSPKRYVSHRCFNILDCHYNLPIRDEESQDRVSRWLDEANKDKHLAQF